MTIISIPHATVLHPLSVTNQNIVAQFPNDFYESFKEKQEKVTELRVNPGMVLERLPSIALVKELTFVGKSDQTYEFADVMVKVLSDDQHDDEIAFFKKLLQVHSRTPDRIALAGFFLHKRKTIVLFAYNGIVIGTEQHRNTFLNFYS